MFIDQCLSPRLERRLSASGDHDAMHLRVYGRLRERDGQVPANCLRKSRTIFTDGADAGR
jgi:predicted nuclease of predicted toxin-antitoxin system